VKRETGRVKRLAGLLAVLAACSDALDQDTTAGQIVAVLNAGSVDLTLVDVNRLEATALLLAPGVPTSLDARGQDLVIALGDSVQVATPTGAGAVIALPDGSGAMGVGIEDDSIAWIANPGLNSATRVNYRTGAVSSTAAGVYPQAVAVTERYVFIVNGNLVGGQPAGLSSLRWRGTGATGSAAGTSPLNCTNAGYATVGGDGLLYVVCSGTAGAADGKLAIVDPVDRREVAVLNGLGESPGPAAYHPSGRLLVASLTEGILEVNTSTRSVVRGPGQGIKPEGEPVAALVVDTRGRVYAVAPSGCTGPGAVHVLRAPPDYRVIATVAVGVCPVAAVLAGVQVPVP
jgi:streptogramin lyase